VQLERAARLHLREAVGNVVFSHNQTDVGDLPTVVDLPSRRNVSEETPIRWVRATRDNGKELLRVGEDGPREVAVVQPLQVVTEHVRLVKRVPKGVHLTGHHRPHHTALHAAEEHHDVHPSATILH